MSDVYEPTPRETLNAMAAHNKAHRTKAWAFGVAIVFLLVSLLFARVAADILKVWHMPGNIDTAALAIWFSVLFMGVSLIYLFIGISRGWRS